MLKRNAMDCGRPECGLCGNPRRTRGEKTVQEMKQCQAQYWVDE